MNRLSLLVVLLVAWLAACESQPSRHYVLSSLSGPVSLPGPERARLALEEVQVPPYLDRRNIVSYQTSNRLDVANLDVWAEPLDMGIARVLREDLARLLADQRIAVMPADLGDADVRLSVWVLRFEQDASGEAALEAQWQLVPADGSREPLLRRSEHREPVSGQGYDGIAAAMNETLHGLSRDIADAVVKLGSPPRR